MVNLRGDRLDGMLETLRGRGVEIVKIFDPEPNGRCAHVVGPDGVTLGPWEPIADDPHDPTA